MGQTEPLFVDMRHDAGQCLSAASTRWHVRDELALRKPFILARVRAGAETGATVRSRADRHSAAELAASRGADFYTSPLSSLRRHVSRTCRWIILHRIASIVAATQAAMRTARLAARCASAVPWLMLLPQRLRAAAAERAQQSARCAGVRRQPADRHDALLGRLHLLRHARDSARSSRASKR